MITCYLKNKTFNPIFAKEEERDIERVPAAVAKIWNLEENVEAKKLLMWTDANFKTVTIRLKMKVFGRNT